MGIFDTFSKRQQRRERAGQPDVYQYDTLPEAFRVQVVHIWVTAIGPYFEVSPWSSYPAPKSNRGWEFIHQTLSREAGVFRLAPGANSFEQCQRYLLTADTKGALDIIEVSFRAIDMVVRDFSYYEREECRITQDADDAIEELNHRFREHAIGYQYAGGEIIRVDSQYLHQQIVRPALALLNQAGFSGPSDEFLRAHQLYRAGQTKQSVAEALKAFESTMKAICDARGWAYPPTASARTLIEVLFKNGLIPPELESHFSALRATLESGLPTVRNRLGGHGQGRSPVEVPEYLAAYALHLAATNIVLLVEAFNTH